MKRGMNLVLCLTLLAVVGLSATSAQELQWHEWSEDAGGNGHEYAVLTATGDWDSQSAVASAEDAYLATIKSDGETAFVLGLIAEAEEDPGPEKYYWFGLVQAEDGQEPDDGWGWVDGAPLADGDYENWAYGEPNDQRDEDFGAIHRTRGNWIDARGHVELRAVIEREEEPDVVPPGTSLDEPDPAVLPWTGTTTVTLAGTVTDDTGGVASATLSIDDEYDAADADYDVAVLLDDTGRFEMTVDLSAHVDPADVDGRSYTISLVAEDLAGNVSPPVTESVIAPADSVAPLTTLDQPDPAELPESGQSALVTITGSAVDGETGIASVLLAVADEYGEAGGGYDVTGLLNDVGEFTTAIEVSAEVRDDDADGRSYEIALLAEDNAGNESEPITVSLTVTPSADTTPPTVALGSPEPAELPLRPVFRPKPVRISGTVIDEDSGIASATVSVEDEYGRCEPVVDITGSILDDGGFETVVYLWAWVKFRDWNGRDYEITLTAVDNEGNEAISDSVIVRSPHPWERLRRIWRNRCGR